MDTPTASVAPVRAAAYIRMSTESQNYSLEHQEAAIAAYALARGFQVVSTYADGGISGLTLQKREGLKRLLSDVLAGTADFSAILTYDVSRWGRFQDVDESAHYEFLCRQAGVQVEYCAEAFKNDGTMVATLLKSIKRVMAAEKSRELSDHITHAKRRMALKGYWPGGSAPFGMRRVTEPDVDGMHETFDSGQANGLKGRRVRLGLGPQEEVSIVGAIFRMAARGKSPNKIARALNVGKPRSHHGKDWTRPRVRDVLQNEVYLGTRVYGRARTRLGSRWAQPRSEWISVPDACPAIISLATFRAAQRALARRIYLTDEQMIDRLRMAWKKHGKLSGAIMTKDPGTPGPSAYCRRFGNLETTYERVGYTQTTRQAALTAQIAPHRVRGRPQSTFPLTNEEIIARLRTLREEEGFLDIDLIEVTPGLPTLNTLVRRFGSLTRVYELVGHEPTARQRARLGKRTDEFGCAPRRASEPTSPL